MICKYLKDERKDESLPQELTLTYEKVQEMRYGENPHQIGALYKEVGKCLVYVDSLSDEEIEDWINKGNPYNKAGGYAIQEEFGKYVTKVEGDFYSIVGLPLNKLYQILKNINND